MYQTRHYWCCQLLNAIKLHLHTIATGLGITLAQHEAFNYYKKNTMSIEILKDDSLQKINFRVKNKVRVTVRLRTRLGLGLAQEQG